MSITTYTAREISDSYLENKMNPCSRFIFFVQFTERVSELLKENEELKSRLEKIAGWLRNTENLKAIGRAILDRDLSSVSGF